MKTVLVPIKAGLEMKVLEDTQFVLDFSKSKRGDVHFVFDKAGISAEIIGIYTARDNEDYRLETITTHKAPHTSCVTYIKGVLFDNGKSEYVGRIIIEKSAQQTSSFLEDHVLVVGENTHTNSEPILEIAANDVKASHAATTGRIDESQVYYLQSRGLSRYEAEEILVEGFFESFLNKIMDSDIKERIHRVWRI